MTSVERKRLYLSLGKQSGMQGNPASGVLLFKRLLVQPLRCCYPTLLRGGSSHPKKAEARPSLDDLPAGYQQCSWLVSDRDQGRGSGREGGVLGKMRLFGRQWSSVTAFTNKKVLTHDRVERANTTVFLMKLIKHVYL